MIFLKLVSQIIWWAVPAIHLLFRQGEKCKSDVLYSYVLCCCLWLFKESKCNPLFFKTTKSWHISFCVPPRRSKYAVKPIEINSLMFTPEPANIEGNAESARVTGLIPWMDYEFQVIASNILGSGEPSMPSHVIRTKQAGNVPKRDPSLTPAPWQPFQRRVIFAVSEIL